ncbi:hypothetical protein PanWU01x14_335320, partial [Parasponia andersonii]
MGPVRPSRAWKKKRVGPTCLRKRAGPASPKILKIEPNSVHSLTQAPRWARPGPKRPKHASP